MTTRLLTVLLGVGLAVAACDVPPPPAQARLWTLNDYVALYQGGGVAPNVPPLPAALPPEKLLVKVDDHTYQLVMSPTLEEGYLAAYLTTDLWQAFDEIWVQPLYTLVTGWSATGAPLQFPASDPRSRPIFSVGPQSRFYSPYWEVLYVKVADDPAKSSYKSVHEILNAGPLEIRRGEARTASLLASNSFTIVPPADDRDLNPTLPAPAAVGPTVTRGTGYLDGQDIDYLDLGVGQFQWDADRVVQEVPLFELFFRDDAGTLHSFGGPKIGGYGSLYSGRQPQPVSSRAQPRYGGYWRLYNVELPASARIFAPSQFPAFRKRLMDAGVPVGDVDGLDPALINNRVGQVGPDASCFASVDAFKACPFLDSQTQLEHELQVTAFTKTDLTVTCPFVSYAGNPVIPPAPAAAN